MEAIAEPLVFNQVTPNPAGSDKAGPFPVQIDRYVEIRKFGLLRICLGVVVLGRLLLNLPFNAFAYEPTMFFSFEIQLELLHSVALLIVASCFTFGFLTPVSTVILFLGVFNFDLQHQSINLGTTILNFTLILFFLMNSGLTWSLDSLILKRFKQTSIAAVIGRLESFAGIASSKQISTYLFMAFILYALTSIGACLLHVADGTWQSGNTLRVLLTSSYLGRFYEFFRAFEQFRPDWLSLFSSIGVVGQTIFQFCMIPLLFTKPGRFFVILWGFVFFVMSICCMQLSYLPVVQVVLWLALFWRPRHEPRLKQMIARDDLGEPIRLLYRGHIAFFSVMSLIYIGSFNFINSVPACAYANRLLGAVGQYSPFMMQFGFCVPDVFNSTDLSMGNTWFCVWRDRNGGELVPLTGMSGERLWYHYSDNLYFTTSLPWRRGMINPKFDKSPEYKSYIANIIKSDSNLNRFYGKYDVVVFRNRSSDISAPVHEKYLPTVVDRFSISPAFAKP